jgi:hypothetical protein|tara:strand:- start:278 stop:451 length:174 start_codon:yes stop_codon:yes gene_type:complete
MQPAPPGARKAYERLTPQQKAEGLEILKGELETLGLRGGILDVDGYLVWETPVKEKK